MGYEGLVDLWQIGRSHKREAEIEERTQRKQIGKFGIGKLASYTIANQLTYISKNQGKTLAVTIDFRSFDPIRAESSTKTGMSNPNPAEIAPIDLVVREIDD